MREASDSVATVQAAIRVQAAACCQGLMAPSGDSSSMKGVNGGSHGNRRPNRPQSKWIDRGET